MFGRVYPRLMQYSMIPWMGDQMDPTAHISSVTLFHYLIHAMPLSEDELRHLQTCEYCQSVMDQFDTYIDPGMIHAA